MVEGGINQQRIKQLCTSRFSRAILVFAIADAALISYISFGYIVPSRMHLPDQKGISGRTYLDDAVKPSPLVAARPEQRAAKADIPLIDATSATGESAAGGAFLNGKAMTAAANQRVITNPAAIDANPGPANSLRYASDPPQPLTGREALPSNSQGWNHSGRPAATDGVESGKGATT